MKNKLKAVYIVLFIGMALTIAAGVACLLGCGNCSAVLSIVSTGISIVLGVFSIVYTYVSGQKTLDNLDKIDAKYDRLVEKINSGLVASNINDNNLANIRRALEEYLQS